MVSDKKNQCLHEVILWMPKNYSKLIFPHRARPQVADRGPFKRLGVIPRGPKTGTYTGEDVGAVRSGEITHLLANGVLGGARTFIALRCHVGTTLSAPHLLLQGLLAMPLTINTTDTTYIKTWGAFWFAICTTQPAFFLHFLSTVTFKLL